VVALPPSETDIFERNQSPSYASESKRSLRDTLTPCDWSVIFRERLLRLFGGHRELAGQIYCRANSNKFKDDIKRERKAQDHRTPHQGVCACRSREGRRNCCVWGQEGLGSGYKVDIVFYYTIQVWRYVLVLYSLLGHLGKEHGKFT